MKAALISLGSVSSRMTAKAMKKYFEVVDSLDLREIEVNIGEKIPQVLYQGKRLKNGYDCIYAKGSFRYASLLEAITIALGKGSYMPIKGDAFVIGHNKLLTHLKLQEYQIPMPTTYLASTSSGAKKILEKINYPIVMKFPSGTQGKGVMFADSFASASSVLDALTALKQPLIIQEYIETGETDIRAFVVGDRVVAAMRRKAVHGEARANIHVGGEGEPCQLDAHTKKVAINAAKTIGAEICAVDMLEGVKGPLVIELNVSPGIQGITEYTKIDVADKIAKYLFEKTKEIKEQGTKDNVKDILQDIDRSEKDKIREIVTNLDFRGERILLPEVVSKLTKFTEEDEVILRAEKGELVIKKSEHYKKR